MDRRTGRHCRPVLQLPTGQSRSLHTCWFVINLRRSWRTWNEQGQSKMNGGKLLRRAVGMAWQRRAGTQPAEQGTAGGHKARRARLLQANTAGGLSARHRPQNKQPAVGRPRSKNNSCRQSWPASRRAVQVSGGSAKVLATQQAGPDRPTLSLPHLSPLPVTVSTHSLNLEKSNLAPNLFFCCFYYFYLYFPL